MFPFRTVVVGTFLPTILFEIGVGGVLPIIAATATGFGASIAVAGVLVTLVPIGHILWDIPAGSLAARIGDRWAMVASGTIAVVAFVLAGLSQGVWMLATAMLLLGAASAGWGLARQSYLTAITPPLRRARVLSTLGGVHRIGIFIGPFVGAGLIVIGSLSWVYWMAAIFSSAAILVVIAAGEDTEGVASEKRVKVALLDVLRAHWRVFATIGTVALLISAVRSARNTVLPLWAEHVGISPEQTSIVFGIAGAVDMLLFYPAGKVMDRMGRLWVGVPAMLVMGSALAFLPLATTIVPLAIVAMVLGLGNGMSSGILMTLGADVAPAEIRPQFLGVFRVFADSGGALGPLVISGAAALGSIAAGIWAMAGTSLASVGAQAVWVPMYSPHANRTTRRRAGLID